MRKARGILPIKPTVKIQQKVGALAKMAEPGRNYFSFKMGPMLAFYLTCILAYPHPSACL